MKSPSPSNMHRREGIWDLRRWIKNPNFGAHAAYVWFCCVHISPNLKAKASLTQFDPNPDPNLDLNPTLLYPYIYIYIYPYSCHRMCVPFEEARGKLGTSFGLLHNEAGDPFFYSSQNCSSEGSEWRGLRSCKNM